jgi:hypothetical protein
MKSIVLLSFKYFNSLPPAVPLDPAHYLPWLLEQHPKLFSQTPFSCSLATSALHSPYSSHTELSKVQICHFTDHGS